VSCTFAVPLSANMSMRMKPNPLMLNVTFQDMIQTVLPLLLMQHEQQLLANSCACAAFAGVYFCSIGEHHRSYGCGVAAQALASSG
jgi:hypothetical protein